MREGWLDDEYLILFEERSASFEKDYGFSYLLPGFRLIGIHGWDEFLVEDKGRNLFTVPTVPLLRKHLAPFKFEKSLETSSPMIRFVERLSGMSRRLFLAGTRHSGTTRLGSPSPNTLNLFNGGTGNIGS